MDLNVQVATGDVARKIMAIVGPEGRRQLLSVAAKALSIEVKAHVRRVAPAFHKSARAMGARPTGHLTKGARAVTFHATETLGTVEVPIPGISRAYHDLEIRPVKASKLTLPAKASEGISYGRTAREMTALGWRLFRGRGRGKNLLFGRREKETRLLYTLHDRVRVPCEPALLPSSDKITETCSAAAAAEIRRVARKVCGGAR